MSRTPATRRLPPSRADEQVTVRKAGELMMTNLMMTARKVSAAQFGSKHVKIQTSESAKGAGSLGHASSSSVSFSPETEGLQRRKFHEETKRLIEYLTAQFDLETYSSFVYNKKILKLVKSVGSKVSGKTPACHLQMLNVV